MFKTKFYNEKGNPSAKVRNAMKEQAFAKVLLTLQADEQLSDASKNANGGFSIPIAEDINGTIIYANLELTVSDKNPAVKSERKKKAVAVESGADEVVSLFGSVDED